MILPPPPPQQTQTQSLVQGNDNHDLHHHHQRQQEEEIVRFSEASSPVTVVSLLLKHNSSSRRPSFSNNNNNNNSHNKGALAHQSSSSSHTSRADTDLLNASVPSTTTSSSTPSSIFRGLYVAAGCEDGTVGVWDTDHLPSSVEGQRLGRGDRTCLFCHQLRPTERYVTPSTLSCNISTERWLSGWLYDCVSLLTRNSKRAGLLDDLIFIYPSIPMSPLFVHLLRSYCQPSPFCSFACCCFTGLWCVWSGLGCREGQLLPRHPRPTLPKEVA